MEARTQEILEMALQLPPGEQEELLVGLADHLSAPDPEIERAWAEEASRRWARVASGEVTTVPWSEVRDGIKRRFGV
jgi:putative addiction module component (TIGR02574 family)